MSTPEERAEARDHANDALEHARTVRDRGATLGERWRKSREDNNFRMMLRQLGRQGISDA